MSVPAFVIWNQTRFQFLKSSEKLWSARQFERLTQGNISSLLQIRGCRVNLNVWTDSDTFELGAIGKRVPDRCDVQNHPVVKFVKVGKRKCACRVFPNQDCSLRPLERHNKIFARASATSVY